jgi:hypothetical protein
MKTTFYIIILISFSRQVLGQEKKNRTHTIDSCSKCYCYKWHQRIDKDSVDNTKIVFRSRARRRSTSNCISDGYRKYQWVTTKYYTNGNIKSIEKQKGWQNGFSGDHKITTIFYDEQGKETKRTTSKKVKSLY